MKKLFSFITIIALTLATTTQSFAQCAMCKTTAESDLNNGGSIASGLNSGILYLMAIPYIVLMTGGYFFFKKQVDAKLKVWRDKLFSRKPKAVS